MTRWSWIAALLFVPPASALQGAPAGAPESAIRWEPYEAETSAGPLAGKLGRIRVPERRGARDGQTIEIAFVVYETAHPEPGPPIVFLAGGPGAPGIDLAAETANDPRLALLASRDVIGIDQRGTGLSSPNLEDGPEFGWELPLDRAVPRDELAAAFRGAVERCVAYWKEQGVDLTAYNSAASADDVDAVREALGLETIVPWGTSYGSHLALAYLRRHPRHVERAVLMRVEGPDHTFKLPSVVQQRLEHLGALVAADPVLGAQLPDLLGTVRGLLAGLEKEPVRVVASRGGEELEVTIGPLDLQVLVSAALGHASNLAELPMALHLMTQGEWRHLVGYVLRTRRGSVGSAMALAMDCASGVSSGRLARIERERRDPANLLGDAIQAPFYPEVCAACGDIELGASFRGKLACAAPVLFVSGALDARTPPENVDALRAGFTKETHVVVANTGHDERELDSEPYRALLRTFLSGGEVADCVIDLPQLPFAPLQTR